MAPATAAGTAAGNVRRARLTFLCALMLVVLVSEEVPACQQAPEKTVK
jgi:hypothetical protein